MGGMQLAFIFHQMGNIRNWNSHCCLGIQSIAVFYFCRRFKISVQVVGIHHEPRTKNHLVKVFQTMKPYLFIFSFVLCSSVRPKSLADPWDIAAIQQIFYFKYFCINKTKVRLTKSLSNFLSFYLTKTTNQEI